jgi:hypothetical protein
VTSEIGGTVSFSEVDVTNFRRQCHDFMRSLRSKELVASLAEADCSVSNKSSSGSIGQLPFSAFLALLR